MILILERKLYLFHLHRSILVFGDCSYYYNCYCYELEDHFFLSISLEKIYSPFPFPPYFCFVSSTPFWVPSLDFCDTFPISGVCAYFILFRTWQFVVHIFWRWLKNYFTFVHCESNIHYQFAGGLLFVGLVWHPDARPGWSADRPVPGRTVDEANGRGRRGTESDHTTVHVSSSSRLDECQSASCHTGTQ